MRLGETAHGVNEAREGTFKGRYGEKCVTRAHGGNKQGSILSVSRTGTFACKQTVATQLRLDTACLQMVTRLQRRALQAGRGVCFSYSTLQRTHSSDARSTGTRIVRQQRTLVHSGFVVDVSLHQCGGGGGPRPRERGVSNPSRSVWYVGPGHGERLILILGFSSRG